MFWHHAVNYNFSRFVIALLAGLAVAQAAADENFGQVQGPDTRYSQLPLSIPESRLDDGRWYVSFDNDFFAPKNRDQDYTYGINFAYASSEVSDWTSSQVLKGLDNVLGLKADKTLAGHSFEFGLYGFTPSNVDSAEPKDTDRPYSSLVYAAATAERLNWADQSLIRTQLTLGILGLDAVGDLQNMTHRLTGGVEAEGWHNQVSNGGEPTFRYSLSRSKLMGSGAGNVEARHTAQASVGYITEVSWGLTARVGRISTPWHSFKPEVKNYAESLARKESRVPESYFWLGAAVKLRAYNAFLQGQFRDSIVTYNHDELRPAVLEVWAGYTHEFASGLHLNYGLRGHTSEIKEGDGDRNVIWGGIVFGRKL